MDKRLNDILALEDWQVELLNLLNLERLITKFPYCSILHMYAARFSSLLNNQNKEAHKVLSAVYISDRVKLKEFLERPATESPLKKKQQQKAEIPTINKDILDEINQYSEPDLSENPTKEELIERFLRIENPKVSTVEHEGANLFTIDKIIKNSASKEFKNVTETMAKLYLQQGNKVMAVKIYEQLMIDNPKKSVYFANRIKEINRE
jgi:predicted XRE-type DNA-binding protein